jgi:hypothetical protein
MFGLLLYLFKEKTNQAYSSDVDIGMNESYQSRAASINQMNQSGLYNQNVMNNANVSYDLYGANYQSKLATRYDHKSQSSASLYGSRVSINLLLM